MPLLGVEQTSEIRPSCPLLTQSGHEPVIQHDGDFDSTQNLCAYFLSFGDKRDGERVGPRAAGVLRQCELLRLPGLKLRRGPASRMPPHYRPPVTLH
jgi:hypothetical protein